MKRILTLTTFLTVLFFQNSFGQIETVNDVDSMDVICKKLLDGTTSYEIILIGESHFDSLTTNFERSIIEKSIKEYGVRHIGLEIPESIGNELLKQYIKNPNAELKGKPEYLQSFYNWFRSIDAGNINLSENEKATPFFFDMQKKDIHNANCEDGNWICTRVIQAQSRYFKDREPIIEKNIKTIIDKRKGRVLIIIGRDHIYKNAIYFGIPELAKQLKEKPAQTPAVPWSNEILEFPELILDDVLFYEKPVGVRLTESYGAKNILSVFVNTKDNNAINEFFSKKNSKTPTIVYTSELWHNDISWWIENEGLYKLMIENQNIPVSKMFDIYIQL
ncbi:MAG TPA: hypothetical protein VK982_08435 [Bacteroidales bacterium]|nr:hypothetical protein [Bacteroidales bacterium]